MNGLPDRWMEVYVFMSWVGRGRDGVGSGKADICDVPLGLCTVRCCLAPSVIVRMVTCSVLGKRGFSDLVVFKISNSFLEPGLLVSVSLLHTNCIQIAYKLHLLHLVSAHRKNHTNSSSFGFPCQSQQENLHAPLCFGRKNNRNTKAAYHGNGGHTAV
jgi:hypothetical protein